MRVQPRGSPQQSLAFLSSRGGQGHETGPALEGFSGGHGNGQLHGDSDGNAQMIATPLDSVPSEILFSGYKLSGANKPGTGLKRARENDVREALARLSNRHNHLGREQESESRSWAPTRELSHYLMHQNTLPTFI